MAESNATQVILTDDGIKIINAQNTADNAASQAENANSAVLIAQSTANAAKSAADSTYDYANSEIAVQSTATAKAQSTADNAFSQAQTVGSQASAEIAVQSTATAKAQSTADNAFSQATTAIDNGKVTSQAVTDLKDGSKLTIADLENGLATKVANSDYASYKVQTASQIADRVSNSAFSTYKTQTADLIAQKVATSDFSAYQATTAKSIDSKVSSDDFNTYKTQTANLIDDKVSSSEYASDKTQTASEIADRVSNSAFSTYQTQTASQIASKVDNGAFSAYQTTTADLIASKVATKDFSAYQATTAKAIDSKVESSDFNTYKTQTDKMISSKVSTTDFNSQMTQLSSDINLRVTKDDLIDEINLQAGNTLISSSGQLTLSGKTIYFDTVNPVIIPSANITGTLNGKTINACTQLNQYGNTSYPLTLSPDGSVTSTSFETISNETAALRTVIKNGTVKTNLRGMTQFATGMYSAADVSLGAGQLVLLEGYSTSQDPNFNATGLKTTGYAILDASTGLSLHGTTQAINFSGTDQDQTTGITMNSYGNIIGYPNATWWRIVSNSGSNIANFGIDKAGSNVIQFNRELDIGNFHINTGHTFTSADNGAIHFAMGKGGAADIYAGDVHYTSLVKSSLLSVKKDVQKADTAYWAQLINAIDLATYQYKTDDNTSHIRLSSIVDDVNDTKQWQLPDVFISRDEKGKLNGVDDSVLLNATLATVQEQQKEIDQLNGHNMELEARLNKLEAKLNG
ncbi:phage tail protein [Lactiplantibacillus plantarum]|uniref:phage tail protein n=1 Tax=Lactiplantibacillus plantarum TaxID=1590 RepID=UPI0015D4DF96|nr:phage tail protein [Lactiplantibacillus plantarum]